MRRGAPRIDAGVADVIAALCQIPGVTTRASCQGVSGEPHEHHAELAYVLFRHPLPLHFRDFLIAELADLGRVDIDGVYSRWPARNGAFVERLRKAADRYLDPAHFLHRCAIRLSLSKLRARCASLLESRLPLELDLCLACEDLVFDPHPAAHAPITVLRRPADQETLWFAEFAALPASHLDPALIVAAGWTRLHARSQQGDFGAAFQRRWLRYRARKLADLTTWQLRTGIEQALRQREDLDFFYTATHAVVAWRRTTTDDPVDQGQTA